MSTTPNLRHGVCRALAFLATAVLALPVAVQAAKPAGGGGGSQVTVTAANPSEAIQGQQLDVIVSGTGFGNGSTVKYLVTGTTDASQVAVLSVEYLPASGQLKTRIQVNEVAITSDYDIEVRTLSGRKGKGTTLFAVKLDPSVILPVDLGVPERCNSSEAYGLNDGIYLAGLTVVGDMSLCFPGKDRAYRWKDGAWEDLDTSVSSMSGSSEGVSNDGTVVGSFFNSSTGAGFTFVASGGTMSPLPAPAGMARAIAYGISQDGTHIVGGGGDYGSFGSVVNAVRWRRDAGGAWSVEVIGDLVEEVIGDEPFFTRQAKAASDDGSVVVGYEGAQWNPYVPEGWVWVEGGSPEWVGLGAGSYASDIDPAATMVVGYRYASCGSSCTVIVPVYWALDGGGNWESHDLAPLDSAKNSGALGVGSVNGELVIVGQSYVPKDSGSVSRAVAWLPQPGGGYGAPIQLAAIDGRVTLGAAASDVNANGVVAGWSAVPGGGNSSTHAVLWMLPAIP